MEKLNPVIRQFIIENRPKIYEYENKKEFKKDPLNKNVTLRHQDKATKHGMRYWYDNFSVYIFKIGGKHFVGIEELSTEGGE